MAMYAEDIIRDLRAELAYEELGRQNDRETAQITIDALEATISRVWAVLDTADVSDRETGFFQDVRDALNGENQ